MGKFDGKIALVAGNLGKMKNDAYTPGLGNEVAKRLVEEGAQVIVVDTDFAAAEACAAAIGGTIKAVDCDLVRDRAYETEEVQTDKGPKQEIKWTDNPALDLVNSIVEEFGKIDVIITNFDAFESLKVDKIDNDVFNKIRDENITPTFHLIAAARDQLSNQCKANGTYAKIVMITSMVGKAGLSMGSVYAAFKGSVVGLNKSLSREYGKFANVNAVAAGPFKESMQGPKDRVKKNYLTTSSDMSNQDITFAKVAPAVLFLASDDAMGITGQTLSVDGGLWLKIEQ
jgi:NAD(P)-dependent dehydrogenase (short-subunit alcohol dehydrogenase family)